jgi:hypothetical protein
MYVKRKLYKYLFLQAEGRMALKVMDKSMPLDSLCFGGPAAPLIRFKNC